MAKSGNITIVESESRFKKVDISLIENPNIDCLTLGVYTKLIVLGRKWQLNVKGLRSHLGLSDEKVRKALTLLEREGYIVRTPSQDEKGRMMGWNYTIYPTPIHESERSQAGVKNEEQCKEKPTPRESAHSERGGLLNNRLNQQLDLIEFNTEEIKENIKRKKEGDTPTEKDHEMFEEFRQLYSGKKRGHHTEFNFFTAQNKDWREVLPKLLYAVKNENRLREQAKMTRSFFPEPKNLQTYLSGKNRAWELYSEDYEPLDTGKYLPQCDGVSLFWNDILQCYITPFDISTLADGYCTDNRPNGATVMWNGWKYIWDSTLCKWEQQ